MAKTRGEEIWENEQEFGFEQDACLDLPGRICWCITEEETLVLGLKVCVGVYLVERDFSQLTFGGKGSPASEVIEALLELSLIQKRLLKKSLSQDHQIGFLDFRSLISHFSDGVAFWVGPERLEICSPSLRPFIHSFT